MLRLIDLTREYDSQGNAGRPVLAADRLNLEVNAGELFGLVGPNGAGKSTALKMICGLLLPTSGRVLVNNVDVERHREEAQKYIGYLADFFSLYDELTVYQYLEYFAAAYKLPADSIPARILEVVMRVGLETKRDSLIGGLSRGMKQRLGIARAVIHDPPLLVLDEPAAGLDPKARHELKQLLRSFQERGRTIVITSHVLSGFGRNLHIHRHPRKRTLDPRGENRRDFAGWARARGRSTRSAAHVPHTALRSRIRARTVAGRENGC